jgi:hypothetical protein
MPNSDAFKSGIAFCVIGLALFFAGGPAVIRAILDALIWLGARH